MNNKLSYDFYLGKNFLLVKKERYSFSIILKRIVDKYSTTSFIVYEYIFYISTNEEEIIVQVYSRRKKYYSTVLNEIKYLNIKEYKLIDNKTYEIIKKLYNKYKNTNIYTARKEMLVDFAAFI